MTKNRYTLEDDKIIVKRIQENPGNLQMVFRLLSKEIPHTAHSIEIHWYTKLSKQENICFMTCGSRRAITNRKYARIDTIKSKVIAELPWYKRFWNKLINL